MSIRTLAISDIHGCLEQFNQLLEAAQYDSNSDHLILLGDYVDRGLKSKQVVEKIMQLQKEHGAIVLRGNHDQMMIDAFEKDEDYNWLANGAYQTIESYVGIDFFEEAFNWDEYIKAKEFIKAHYSHHLEFLKTLKYYHETDTHIFVHAGINPLLEDWKETSDEEFIWIRGTFHSNPTKLDKPIVFGHTPTVNFNPDSADIIFSGDKIAIDGACAYGYQLNCLEIHEDGYSTYRVSKNKKPRWETE